MYPNDGRVISNFIVQALRGENITVYGDGHQTRSFCYVDDLIDGLIKLMDSPDDLTGPVNLGAPEESTILDLAEKIIDLAGSKSKIVYVAGSKSKIVYEPLPNDDPVRRCPDISMAKEKLNWQPTVPLTEGLNKTIDYFSLLLNK
jgi:UDP-glucuronate decarboxylase